MSAVALSDFHQASKPASHLEPPFFVLQPIAAANHFPTLNGGLSATCHSVLRACMSFFEARGVLTASQVDS